jgi:hypothetical protein
MVCPTGQDVIVDQCRETLYDALKFQCSAGWNLNNKACDRTLTSPVNYYCPTGQENHTSTLCKLKAAALDIGSCPNGYLLNETTGRCEKKDLEPVDYSCENNPNITLNNNQCDYFKSVPPYTQCDLPFKKSDDGALCIQKIEESGIPACKSPEYTPLVSQSLCVKEERVPFSQ